MGTELFHIGRQVWGLWARAEIVPMRKKGILGSLVWSRLELCWKGFARVPNNTSREDAGMERHSKAEYICFRVLILRKRQL